MRGGEGKGLHVLIIILMEGGGGVKERDELERRRKGVT